MRCRVPVLLCALLVVLLAVGATPAVAASDVEETHMEIQLEEDGDATWTVVGAVPLENDSDVESFESFAADFESGQGDVELGESAFQRAADEASTETGREMRVHSVVRRSAVVEETDDDDGEVTRRGELRVSFTWTNFARVEEDGTMRVDDAFNTTEGTWLPGLEDGQSLTVRPPSGYSAPDAPIGPSEGAYRWEGPETFEPGYLAFVFEPGLNPLAGVGVSTLLLSGAVVVSGVALALGGYLLWRRGGVGGDVPWPATGNPSTEAGTADDANGPAPEATATGDGSGAVGAATTVADDAVGSDAEPDFELLSDEERVEYLLEQNGGRMKQARIVDETGWSNAKVSQLLSAMAEDERVDKLRIGRENLISLPGEGFTDLDDEPSE